VLQVPTLVCNSSDTNMFNILDEVRSNTRDNNLISRICLCSYFSAGLTYAYIFLIKYFRIASFLDSYFDAPKFASSLFSFGLMALKNIVLNIAVLNCYK